MNLVAKTHIRLAIRHAKIAIKEIMREYRQIGEYQKWENKRADKRAIKIEEKEVVARYYEDL